jgi:hypothetical protein
MDEYEKQMEEEKRAREAYMKERQEATQQMEQQEEHERASREAYMQQMRENAATKQDESSEMDMEWDRAALAPDVTRPSIHAANIHAAVTASLNYMNDASSYIAFMPDAPLAMMAQDVPIVDARPHLDSLGLSTSGFSLQEHHLSLPVDKFYDPHTVRKEYYPEIEKIALDASGASQAIVVGHVVRNEKENLNSSGKDSLLGVHQDVHTDFTAAYAARITSYLTPGTELHDASGIQVCSYII